MGLSSSQARLLNLTSRMHQIEYKAAKLESQKLQMANESKKVYQEYQNAMEQTKIQYKSLNSDASVTFLDASYYDLCLGESNIQVGMFSTKDNKVFIPQRFADIYELSGHSADFFAETLSDYVPMGSASSSAIPTSVEMASAIDGFNQINPTNMPASVPPQTIIPDTPQSTPRLQSLRMGGESNYNITPEGITLELKDPYNSSKSYFYTITSDSNSTANFKYLKNGRLVITGNNLTITANGNQNDDIILFGDNNKLDTGSGKDTVRVGIAVDTYTENHSFGKYSSNNIIKTGSGDDYVINYGRNNSVDMGDGSKDKVYDYSRNLLSLTGGTTVTNSGQDNQLGAAYQQLYGDCKFLSFLNSLKAPLSNFVNIQTLGNGGYKVTFNACPNKPQVVSISSDSNLSKGDLDNIIVEKAFQQIIASDNCTLEENASNSFGSSRNNYLVSKYFFGLDRAGQDLLDRTKFANILQEYVNGNVSNLVVGTDRSVSKEASELGIMHSHAYAVKYGNDKYIELVNPHDGNDVIRLDLNTFYSNFHSVTLFGDTYNKYLSLNGNSITYPSNVASHSGVTSISNNVVYNAEGSDINAGGKYNALKNLFKAIEEYGYEIIPDDMMGKREFLVNMLNDGFAYLKEFDKKEDSWLDTSVATNTSLQEVADESELRKAEAKYEADMRRIDYKDRKFDYDLAALDQERNAIKNEMETLKTVAKDNVERTFRLFT